MEESYDEFEERIRKEISFENIKAIELMEKLKNHHRGTYKHNFLVAKDVEYVAKKLGYPKKEIRCLTIAAAVHDMGKLDVHRIILDLAGKKEQVKIWNYANKQGVVPDKPIEHNTPRDIIRYYGRNSENPKKVMEEFIEWMKKNNSKKFIDLPMRTWLDYHQEATKKHLEKINLNPKILFYAATHHPEYFQEELNFECQIIGVCDKFNAMIQSEGDRSYAKRKSVVTAIETILMYSRKRKEYRKTIKIIELLSKKYVIPYAKRLLKTNIQVDHSTLEEMIRETNLCMKVIEELHPLRIFLLRKLKKKDKIILKRIFSMQ